MKVVDITDVNSSARRAFFVLSAFLNMISRPMHPAITISTGKKSALATNMAQLN